MNVNYVTTKPVCVICERAVNEVIDAPTKAGPWADMCGKCIDHNAAVGYRSVGSIKRFRSNALPMGVSDGPAMTVIEKTSDASLLTKDRRCQCPRCKHIFLLEPDAEGTKPCDKCGQKLAYEARI